MDWDFIKAGAGWGVGIALILVILDGAYCLICRWIYRKKKPSRQWGNTDREGKAPGSTNTAGAPRQST